MKEREPGIQSGVIGPKRYSPPRDLCPRHGIQVVNEGELYVRYYDRSKRRIRGYCVLCGDVCP